MANDTALLDSFGTISDAQLAELREKGREMLLGLRAENGELQQRLAAAERARADAESDGG